MTTTIPRSTYRLQLHEAFDFAAARKVLPYLARLGISHLYLSPIWQARPGSTHGYDVVDHGRVSDALGGEAGFRQLAAEARALGLGILLDIVPNHMGVFGATNPWWLDVLENGPASEAAEFFDIDWQPPNPWLQGKLLVPVLGDHYGAVLDGGGLRLAFDPAIGRFEIVYEEHHHPLDPATYPQIFAAGSPPAIAGLIEAFAALPGRNDAEPAARASRRTQQRALQQRLAEAAGDPAVASAIGAAVAGLNDEPGRARLGDLHDQQAFRLAYWRVASGEINYRRFFDINALAALRVEDPRVFEATQGLALDFAAEGLADGLRVDHSDGLYDPAGYFVRLQQGYAARRAARGADSVSPDGRPVYVLAEKILANDEFLPADWAIHGTTGYDFAVLLNGLYVDRRNEDRLDRVWRTYTGNPARYRDIVRECKRRIATRALGSELTVLSNALQRIALADRRTRDYSLADLRTAIADVVACLPVYRTYVIDRPSAQDVRFIEAALEGARATTELDDPTIFDFIRSKLLDPSAPAVVPVPEAEGSGSEPLPVVVPARPFPMRFQQFASPVAAKGVEDTAFYRDHRLVSLSEVGGSPAVFGTSAEDFHRANAERIRHWPHTMLASSTHDNKRAEDVRYRIDTLSERPAALRLGLRRWRGRTRAWLTEVDGRPAPSPEDQVLLYQTLIGSLPAQGFGPGELEPYRERIVAYMTKAVREAKLETRWSRPNDPYEKALQTLIEKVLPADAAERPAAGSLLGELLAAASEAAWFGALNGVSATVLKLTVPGVPDTYQGTELIDLSLVDPDNRRPVDYDARRALIDDFERAAEGDDLAAVPRAMLRSAPDGRLKLWCLWRLLQLRRAEPALFATGAYQPLRVQGARRDSAIAFARRGRASTLIVVAGRKFTRLDLGQEQAPDAATWGDTTIRRPAGFERDAVGVDVLSGRRVPLGGDRPTLASLLDPLPVAALIVPSRPI